MTRKRPPTDALRQARDIGSAWNQISPSLALGDLDLTVFWAELEQAERLDSEVNQLRTQLVDRLNQRNDAYLGVWENVKRVRSGVKGYYGDDSSQYEMVGGTRLSERKPRARKGTG